MKSCLIPAAAGMAGMILALLAPASALAAAPSTGGCGPSPTGTQSSAWRSDCAPGSPPGLAAGVTDGTTESAQIANLQQQITALQTAMNQVDEQLYHQPFPPPAAHALTGGSASGGNQPLSPASGNGQHTDNNATSGNATDAWSSQGK